MAYLVQLLLPLYDNEGAAFPAEYHAEIRRELTERFGGVTSYNRAPAIGVWQDRGGRAERDDIVVCEVMMDELDKGWWQSFRETVEKKLAQKELVVRAISVERL